ncbi:hypothetical protein DL990_20165 [Amycolatopsis sp. WAC 01416]|uniref:hypothetical protein n=1 Tax=Amycolatopsis sp. WAC 01416 TaxID=2203196 RepID=UPI000F78DC41|nr:hypothetical protein [Amycolatopsis sp. WAC 01416]RSN32232.1 hypothetical protein DL990_20165 [Amycolatopsis sp. WAC 01416]
MGLFSPARDPEDPEQLATAAHELGHAWVWKDAGFTVTEIRFLGDEGWVSLAKVRESDWDQRAIRDYAVGCWAGFEAEERWRREHRLKPARRGHAAHDIKVFKNFAKELKPALSEGKARSLARDRVARRWSQIQRQAPVLVRDGRISL